MKIIKKIFSTRIIVCLLCVFVLFSALSFGGCSSPKQERLVQVVRATDYIGVGERFTNTRITTVVVAESMVPEGAVTDREVLKKKYAISEFCPGDFVVLSKTSDTQPSRGNSDLPVVIVDDKIDYEALGYLSITQYADEVSSKNYTEVIKKAIKENPNRTIYFPDGTYYITEPIDIPADAEGSVSLRLSNNAVISALGWQDRTQPMIRIGVGSSDNADGARPSIVGGCIQATGASGISVEESSRNALISNVSIKGAYYGIHIKKGNNASGSTYTTVDNVNIVGYGSNGSVGILVDGSQNTVSNSRIMASNCGVKCTESGSGNSFKNVHPLCTNSSLNDTVGFWDLSNGNFYDTCYSDHYSVGFRMAENTVSVYDGCYTFWYQNSSKQVAFEATGKFNSIIMGSRMSRDYSINSVNVTAFLTVGKDGGNGVIINPFLTFKTMAEYEKRNDYLK